MTPFGCVRMPTHAFIRFQIHVAALSRLRWRTKFLYIYSWYIYFCDLSTIHDPNKTFGPAGLQKYGKQGKLDHCTLEWPRPCHMEESGVEAGMFSTASHSIVDFVPSSSSGLLRSTSVSSKYYVDKLETGTKHTQRSQHIDYIRLLHNGDFDLSCCINTPPWQRLQ
jgi:hypothetical protein